MGPFQFLHRRASSKEDDLGSFSDLMSALALVFLLISVVLLDRTQAANRDAAEAKASLEAMQQAYEELRVERDLFKPYHDAFEERETTRVAVAALLNDRISAEELGSWRAEFDPENLAFRFNDPDTLFSTGSSALSPTFIAILREFIPRLFEALSENDAYRDLAYIRIEGHTSSEWTGESKDMDPRAAHIRNMELSQLRAFSVVQHLADMPEIREHWNAWARQRIQAVGVGPNRLVHDAAGVEDQDRSRRVEVWIVPRNLNEELLSIAAEAP